MRKQSTHRVLITAIRVPKTAIGVLITAIRVPKTAIGVLITATRGTDTRESAHRAVRLEDALRRVDVCDLFPVLVPVVRR
jgi:hypothetical protein